MNILFLAIALLALSYVLSRATDVLVAGIKQLAEGTAMEAFGLTTFLVALATSLPELFVGVTAAIEGETTLPLGVAVGSNIANVSLILGGAAVISGSIKARGKVLKKEIVYGFLIGSLPLLLLLDKVLSRGDGLVLLVVYGMFVAGTMSRRRKRKLEEVEDEYYDELDLTHRILRMVGKKDIEQGLARLVAGSALLIICADLIVRLAAHIAELLSIPVMWVGLFMVSIGTSLPELSFEIRTVKKKEYMMAFGNILGSTVANSSLLLGLVSLLKPIRLVENSASYFLSVIVFVVVFMLFWGFTWTKRKLERWEGVMLLAAYFGFVAIQMWMFS